MDYALPILKEKNFSAVVFMVTGFIGKRAVWDVPFAGARYWHLNGPQLRELVAHGWEVGSHTVTHRALPWLNSGQLQWELEYSRITLMQLIGEPVESIAYPFGLVNSRVIKVVQHTGYRVGTGSPFWKNSKFGLLNLPRIPVFPWYRGKHIVQLLNGSFSLWQRSITAMVRWPAVFTPFYQALFRRHLWH